MKRRKWWFWLLIALACLVLLFVIAELIGASVPSVLGWGALGVVGFIAAMFFAGVSFILPFLFRILLVDVIRNQEIRSIVMGVMGACAIFAAWMPTGLGEGWSLFLMMSGFSLGCLAGAEYQKYLFNRESKPQEVREEIR